MVRTDSKARKIDSFLVKMDGDNNDGSYIDDGGNIDGNDGEDSNGDACNDGGSFSNYNSYGNNEDKVTNNNAFGKDDGEGLEGVKRTLFEGDGGDNTNTSFSNNDYIECTSLKITGIYIFFIYFILIYYYYIINSIIIFVINILFKYVD